MLTPERIEKIAEEFIVEDYTRDIPADWAVDFARALLAEVKLQDLLEKEEEFIKDSVKGVDGTIFNSKGVTLSCPGYKYGMGWDEYFEWKQQLGLDELTDQAQEVKK